MILRVSVDRVRLFALENAVVVHVVSVKADDGFGRENPIPLQRCVSLSCRVIQVLQGN